jgi:dolichyl-diphosphooligosaccharide--protein glycosyltransferase
MSKRFDQFEERLADYESQIDTVYRLYHIPVLAALMVFMLWVRVRNYARHIGPDGKPLYVGNDAYYHYRSTNYVIENFPYTMPFDPWTGFDAGTRTGQFGTIFDQIVATVALVLGLGSPSQETVVMTTLFAAPVIATLAAIPMYYVGKRLGGRFGGIIAVLILALSPGFFLTRSVAGAFDHQIAEALFTLLILAVGMKFLAVAQREGVIFEFVRTREFGLMREPMKWAVILGIVFTLAVLNWPPAIFLYGVFGAFLFVILSLEFIRGHSPDHITIPSVVAMVTSAVLLAPFIATTDLTPTDYSIVHTLLALAVAGGAIFMAGVARLWEKRGLDRRAYPLGILGVGVVGVGIIAVAIPELLDFFVSQFLRVAGLGTTDTAATIGEARSPSDPTGLFFNNYGLGFYTALAGILLVLYHVVSRERPRAEYLLIAVFGAFMLLFTLTQVRFEIHFIAAVGAGNAYLVGWIYQFVDLDNVREDITSVKPYQMLIVVAILFIIAGPIVVTGSTLSTANGASQPGEMQQFTESLDWLSEETPEVGAYGTGGDRSLDYYGSYENREDYEYSDGEYGVMAWWDYGHYITTRGERIPVANPFQQHATESADFLLAGNESHSIEILNEDQPEGESVQYAMVDYQLAYSGSRKYNAPAAYESRHDLSRSDIGVQILDPQSRTRIPAANVPGTNRPVFLGAHTQRGYESMRVRLYQHHGSAREASDITVHFGEYSEEGGYALQPEEVTSLDDLIQRHDSPEAAAEVAENDPRVIQGGVFGQPSERTEALEQFRLVHAGGQVGFSPYVQYMAFEYGIQPGQLAQEYGLRGYEIQHTPVKTFERVDGASIEGTGPANTEIRATVEMEIRSTGQTFPYTQFAETDADGDFEMTVPYSTTGYDEYGPEDGFTNPNVRANSSYQFIAAEQTAIGQADVSEAQVIGEDDSPVTVELEPLEIGQQQADTNQTDGGGTTEGENTEASQITRTP